MARTPALPSVPMASQPVPTLTSGLQHQIFWLWTTGGCHTPQHPRPGRMEGVHVPSWQPKPLEIFLEEVAQATQQIYILDPHFDEPVGIRGVWDYIVYSNAGVKILVSKTDSKKDLQKWLKDHPDPKQEIRSVDIRKTDLEFHDRFAVVDSELWHFGSTVGGAQPQFSAVTRGWSANEFRIVFDRLWKEAT